MSNWRALRQRQRYVLDRHGRARRNQSRGGRRGLRTRRCTSAGTIRESPMHRTRSSLSTAAAQMPAAASARRSIVRCSVSLQAQTQDVIDALASAITSPTPPRWSSIMHGRRARLRRLARLFLGRGVGTQRRRSSAAPGRLLTQTLHLRARTRTRNDSLDDDPSRRARGVCDSRRPSLSARRLQRPLQRPGARPLRARELVERTGRARALRSRRRQSTRPSPRAGLRASRPPRVLLWSRVDAGKR